MLVKIIDSNGNRNIQRGVETENWERATSNDKSYAAISGDAMSN